MSTSNQPSPIFKAETPQLLSRLSPKWVTTTDIERKNAGIGLVFTCPAHPAGDHRIIIYFENPLDGGLPIEKRVHWKRTGETFDTLTVEPSIRYMDPANDCEWHGWIRNGQVITV